MLMHHALRRLKPYYMIIRFRIDYHIIAPVVLKRILETRTQCPIKINDRNARNAHSLRRRRLSCSFSARSSVRCSSSCRWRRRPRAEDEGAVPGSRVEGLLLQEVQAPALDHDGRVRAGPAHNLRRRVRGPEGVQDHLQGSDERVSALPETNGRCSLPIHAPARADEGVCLRKLKPQA